MLYQKDGLGELFRLYLDRIHAPETLDAMKCAEDGMFRCKSCGKAIGIMADYVPEDRMAIVLFSKAIIERLSDGALPAPDILKKREMIIPGVDLDDIARRNNSEPEKVKKLIAMAKKSMISTSKSFIVKEYGLDHALKVVRNGVGRIITPAGRFWLFDFSLNDEWQKYYVVYYGKLDADFMPDIGDRIALRIDSGCESGQKFGDLTCDCRDQLLRAMKLVAQIGYGLVINIPHQDGRGMGMPFKLATLTLQDELGLNTVEAASVLTDAGEIDRRSYAGVVGILNFLGISNHKKLRLITNNPCKNDIFAENGYYLSEKIPIVIPPTDHTRHHLAAKGRFLGHRDLLLIEESEPWR